MFGFVCELVGAIVVGGYLLLFARHQPLKVLVDTTLVHTNGNYLPAFLASSLAAMFCYYGFEACGDVAEETPDASRMIPKAMRMTIYIGGAAATWVCLAVRPVHPGHGCRDVGRGQGPDRDAVARGHGRGRLPGRHRGGAGVLHFLSAESAGRASRLTFAYARDQMIFGSKYLSRMSPGTTFRPRRSS